MVASLLIPTMWWQLSFAQHDEVVGFVQDEEAEDNGKTKKEWDVTLARGVTRDIEFSTEEGTFMSVDVSPDGNYLVFDLLAHIYRMPIAGGEAEVLTQDSGVATNYHPMYSPDGKHVAFISDRAGQNNLWIMGSDGSDPKVVAKDLTARHLTPSWSADSNYIYVQKAGMATGSGRPDTGIWMYHKDGGKGVELIGRTESGASWPSPSSDGKSLYYQKREGNGPRDALGGYMQVSKLDLASGNIISVTSGVNAQQNRGSSGGAAAPEISPNGRYIAFIRRIPDGTISYKGQKFGPRTSLWLRDNETGSERLIMDPVEQDIIEGMKSLRVLPGYSFTPDGNSIIISQGGKFRKLDLGTGDVSTIPFTANVKRTVSQQAYKKIEINDDPFEAKFLRWYTASPDGSKILFQAIGKIWMQDAKEGAPTRLTKLGDDMPEFSPSWSPDGRSVSFVTWNEDTRGSLYTIRANGSRLKKISSASGEFIHPDWSSDGKTIVFARGSNATARGRNITDNHYWDIAHMPSGGGAVTVVGRVTDFMGSRQQLPRPHWGPDGRIFYMTGIPSTGAADSFYSSGPDSQLVSVSTTASMDGVRVHAKFQYTDEAVISPDGSNIAFLSGDNVYVSPFPYNSSANSPIFISKEKGKLPVKQLSTTGGLYPNFRDGNTLEFGSSNSYYSFTIGDEEPREIKLSLMVERDIPTGKIALTNARVVTMDGREVLEGATIVVDGARISCVGTCSTDSVDKIVDASGKTITPGFIDMHAHHFREYNGIIPPHAWESAIYLAYGVTTGLDNSMWSQNVFSAGELVDAGKLIGPRSYSTGDPLYNRAGPRQNLITTYGVAEENIQRLKSWGAVSIKQYLQPRRDQRQWISDIARKEGLMVTSEGSDLAYNMGMIMDGQTAFEHPMPYMPLYSDAAKFFGLTKTVYSPTFIVGGSAAWNEEYWWNESDVWKDEKARKWLPWRALVPNTRRPVKRPDSDYSFPLVAQGMADIIAEGGYGAIGSHGQQHGIGSHWEIWMAASATGNHGALDVATRQGAYFLGAIDDIGTIEVGKLADLNIFNSNPIENIRNTADIKYVMKGGILYEADSLDEIWPNKTPFGPKYWDNQEIYRIGDKPVDFHENK